MRTKLAVIAIFSLFVIMVVPSYAEVTQVSTEKNFYTIVEKISFTGTESQGSVLVNVIITDPNGKSKLLGGFSDPEGEFYTIPQSISNIFTLVGTYNATAFVYKIENGTSLSLEFDGEKVFEIQNFVLTLKSIPDKLVEVEKTITFTASLTDSSIKDAIFSLSDAPAGATIDSSTGKFVWTPSKSQGNIHDVIYDFDIIVIRGTQKDTENITITIKQAYVEPIKEPKEAKSKELAAFVDETKDPQSYVDRYNTEASYKKWFDDNYSEYSSIYEAVGLKKPLEIPAAFVDETKDPQSYVDRYNTEASYKKWFDDNYSEYSSIYEAVELEEPKILAAFVDPNLDPQYYIDRYNKEITYKEWFDKTYPEITIYKAVGLDEPEEVEPEFGQCGEGTRLMDEICTIFDEIEHGQCGEGTELNGKVCEIIGKTTVTEKPWWQFW